MSGGGVSSGGSHADFPKTRAQIMHIFRKREGHFQYDTPENRKLIYDTANNPANFVGKDARKALWYARKLKDGNEVWVKVYEGIIGDAGINKTPALWDPIKGLVRPGKKTSGKTGKGRKKT